MDFTFSLNLMKNEKVVLGFLEYIIPKITLVLFHLNGISFAYLFLWHISQQKRVHLDHNPAHDSSSNKASLQHNKNSNKMLQLHRLIIL